MDTLDLSGDKVRVPDPRVGTAVTVRRYRQERAVVLHPDDFHRLVALEELVAETVRLPALEVSDAAAAAHANASTPGESITDPVALDELFGR